MTTMERRRFSAIVIVALWVFVWTVGACAQSQHLHHHETGSESGQQSLPQHRLSLHLSAPVQEGLKLTMREHLEALQEILGALARDDYEKAAAIAHEDLGFPKHHQAMQREQGFAFPSGYQKLAMVHHQVAEDLAQVIPSKDMPRIFKHLNRTVKACVACHQTYKL